MGSVSRIAASLFAASLLGQDPVREGMEAFAQGKLEESLRLFDQAGRSPEVAPHLWQRGITQYYLGKLDECARQFEVHATVNPNDVENSAWWFLCTKGKKYPPVTGDGRIPMAEVNLLYAGKSTPEKVLAAAKAGGTESLFYAHLYIALWHEARDECALAKPHIVKATKDYAATHYMGVVAQVHRKHGRCRP